jgi:hypothetical protein
MTTKITETEDQIKERTLDRTPENSPENSRTEKIESKSETGTSGKGMPAQTPPAGGGQLGTSENEPRDASGKSNMSLPHERDQWTDMTPDQPDPMIEQASRDLKNGLKDTSKANETDRTYEKYR